jgi:inhibitor of cysteine peptidase
MTVPQQILTAADNGTTIETRPGTRILVRLPENPTTGYRWTPEQGDERVIAPLSSEYATRPDAAVGGGGSAVLAFEARAPGEGTIRLKRWRDWEGEGSVRERYEVKVRVRSE